MSADLTIIHEGYYSCLGKFIFENCTENCTDIVVIAARMQGYSLAQKFRTFKWDFFSSLRGGDMQALEVVGSL